VLGGADGPSFLAGSMSVAAKLLKGQFDTGGRARVAWVRTQCGPNRGLGKCPLELSVRGLRFTSVAYSFFDCL
jgi:hypothetical protein